MADKCKECGSREPKPMHDMLGHDPKTAALEARRSEALRLLADDVKRGNQ